MLEQAEKLDSSWLAARVARDLSATRRIAYAQISPTFEIQQVSQNFSKLVLEETGNIVGHPIFNAIWELVGAEDSLNQVLSGEIPAYWLKRVTRHEDETRPRYYDFKIIPLRRKQPSHGLLLIIEDVTEAGLLEKGLVQDRNELRLTQHELGKTNQKLDKLNRMKSLFLAMAAHDLRTPLSAIRGYVQLLQELAIPEDSEDGKEFVSIVLTQIEQLNRLIGDLLDLDQIDQGKLRINPQMCDLVPIVRSISEIMESTLTCHRLTFEMEAAGSRIPIFADPERVQQIYYNLLTNAIKYTRAGGSVRVKASSVDGYGELLVEDTGIGMNEAQISKLFTIYYRTVNARESKTEGTGLGLYIVKTLVDAHSGKISVKSQPEKGTAITVQIPTQRERNG